MNCRHCGSELNLVMADLGTAPPSNAFLTEKDLERHEVWFPLRVLVCESCWLVQTQDFSEAADLFTADYVYLSAYSKSWLAHAERYVDMVVNRFALDSQSFVLEVAANDGYLLQYVAARGLRHLGVEATHLAAEAASALLKVRPPQSSESADDLESRVTRVTIVSLRHAARRDTL